MITYCVTDKPVANWILKICPKIGQGPIFPNVSSTYDEVDELLNEHAAKNCAK